MVRSDSIGIRKGWDNMKKKVTSKKVTEPKAKDRVLVLRTCDANLGSYKGFKWPKNGAVKAPDFAPTAECGQGLHGFLWGEGDGNLASFDACAKWLVVSVDATEIIQLDGKVKFPRGIVEFCGDRKEATDYLAARVPAGMTPAIIGRFAVAGDQQTALSGYGGTSTSGYGGTSTSGDRGTSTSGDRGTSTSGGKGASTSGDRGTSTSGDRGTSTSGNWGTSTSGDRGTSTSGYEGTSTSGYEGTSTSGGWGTSTSGDRGTSTSGDRGASNSGNWGTCQSGEKGTISIKWYDSAAGRYRTVIGYIGGNGLKANVWYRLDASHQFEEVKA